MKKSRSDKKKIKLISRVIPEIMDKLTDSAKFVESVTDLCDSAIIDHAEATKSEKEKIGYNIGDLSKYSELIKFRTNKKKISKKFNDVLLSDFDGGILHFDNMQGEVYIVAKVPALEMNFLSIIWIGEIITQIRRDKNNTYYIDTDKCRLIYDHNNRQIDDFEPI